ncbi:hypothetical protein PG984_008360 [Apiospora sp. TS-2023a]
MRQGFEGWQDPLPIEHMLLAIRLLRVLWQGLPVKLCHKAITTCRIIQGTVSI